MERPATIDRRAGAYLAGLLLLAASLWPLFRGGVGDFGWSGPRWITAPGSPPPAPASATVLRIHDIQGVGHTSPYSGTLVADVPGVVTVKRSNGFFMQDPLPDADPRTSEGIFVFTGSGSNPPVNPGDSVAVAGRVVEFRPPNGTTPAPANLTTTEISATNAGVAVLSTGNPTPSPVVVGAAGRPPPTVYVRDPATVPTGDVETSAGFDPSTNGLDFLESLEGMLVRVNNPVVVGPRNAQGSFTVLADDGAAAASRRNARGGVFVSPDYDRGFNPDRIVVDDDLAGVTAPNVNVGDHLTGPDGAAVVGVVDYSFSTYTILATRQLTRVAGPISRQQAVAAPAGEIAIASYNVENLSPAAGAARFTRVADTIVNGLRSPDILAVQEIQDNSGPTDDGVVDASLTVSTLIAAIRTAGGPSYQARWLDPVNNQDGGQTGGNIRQVFLFRTDRGVAFVDRPGGSASVAAGVTSVGGRPQLTQSPGRVEPTNPAFVDSRKPLVAEFAVGGRSLFVVANHFNSKDGDDPLLGRFQPPRRPSEAQRLQQATVVGGFVQGLLAVDPLAAVVVAGDLNDFAFSPTLTVLKAAGLANLVDTLPASERYSYVRDGNAQVFDHLLVSQTLAGAVTGFGVVHLNAEFYDTGTATTTNRASDHDPLAVRLDPARGTPPTSAPPVRLVSPVRVVDTRPTSPGGNVTTTGFDGATGLAIAPGPLAAGVPRQFRLGGRSFGGVAVPADATGVLVNVTVVQPSASGGFVTVYPGDAARPNASTVNPSTAVAANFAVVALPTAGAGMGNLAVYSTNAADVAIDLLGYFSPTNPSTAGAARLIAPVRVLDTRPTDPSAAVATAGFDAVAGTPIAPGPLEPGDRRRYALAGRTFGAASSATTFPADVAGLIAHVTVVQPAASGGFVSLLPGDAGTAPTVSTVNPSTAVAFNGWVVGLPAPGQPGAGTFAVYSTNRADVIVDVVGYYAPSAVGASGAGDLTPVSPVRVVDTRPSDAVAGIATTGFAPDGQPIPPQPLDAGSARRFLVAGRAFTGLAVPADVKGVLANVTLVQGAPSGGFLTVFPGDVADANRPNASTVNPVTSVAASFWGAGLAPAGAASAGTLGVYSTNRADVLVDVLGYFR